MSAVSSIKLLAIRKETDSLGEVDVPASKLWGAQTQRSLEHFNIGKDLIPREMIAAYATLKKAAANANHAGRRLDDERHRLIVQTCDEILAGQHEDMFPLHVWMTGSGTQFNMNVNEVISNRCCQLAGTPLGSKTPVHPNDHVNMSQSSNDSFPYRDEHCGGSERERATDTGGEQPCATRSPRRPTSGKTSLRSDALICRMPLRSRLGRNGRATSGMLSDNLERIEDALEGCVSPRARRHSGRHRHQCSSWIRRGSCCRNRQAYEACPSSARRTSSPCRVLTMLSFSSPARCALSAVSLYKIANDIRLMSCGPRAGFRRVGDPGERAGIVDYARQGESHPGRGADHDRRAGDGQRCSGRLRRRRAAIWR